MTRRKYCLQTGNSKVYLSAESEEFGELCDIIHGQMFLKFSLNLVSCKVCWWSSHHLLIMALIQGRNPVPLSCSAGSMVDCCSSSGSLNFSLFSDLWTLIVILLCEALSRSSQTLSLCKLHLDTNWMDGLESLINLKPSRGTSVQTQNSRKMQNLQTAAG